MLSYRHAFHAGNHADVLKHFVLLQLLRHLNLKDKPYWVIDTHAGAGLYRLDEGYATKNAEFREGVARLLEATDLPAALGDYVALVRKINGPGPLQTYPGSPCITWEALREEDRLRLFELHPGDHQALSAQFATAGRRVKVEKSDGFAALKALLPPPPRRGLVLIDPPYEQKEDYQRVPAALEEALKRFETGIYAAWYPLLQRQESRLFADRLKKLPAKNWLHVTLNVHAPSTDGFGMHGSGMFVINPPWTLHDALRDALPWLARTLARDAGASFHIEQQQA